MAKLMPIHFLPPPYFIFFFLAAAVERGNVRKVKEKSLFSLSSSPTTFLHHPSSASLVINQKGKGEKGGGRERETRESSLFCAGQIFAKKSH